MSPLIKTLFYVRFLKMLEIFKEPNKETSIPVPFHEQLLSG